MILFLFAFGFYGVLYTVVYVGLRELLRNSAARWTVVWLLLSSVEYLGSFFEAQLPPPWSGILLLPGMIAFALTAPFWLAKVWLLAVIEMIFGTELSLEQFVAEGGGLKVFLFDCGSNFILCLAGWTAGRCFALFLWSLRPDDRSAMQRGSIA